MKTILFSALLISFCVMHGYSQMIEEWSQSYGIPANYEENYGVYVDENDDIYVCGYVDEELETLASIIKYNSDGQQLWIKTFTSGNGFDVFRAITGDNNGHIFVTGIGLSENEGYNAITVKFDLDGFVMWSHSFDGGSQLTDSGLYIEIDQPGNVYIGGFSEHYENEYAAGADFLALKYNPIGVIMWSDIHNGTGDNRDVVYGMTLAPTGHLYVTGTSGILPNDDTGLSGDDWLTLKYNTNGDLIWTAVYHNDQLEEFFGETPREVKVDSQNNVIVSGWAANGVDMGDMFTIKYNENGTELWNHRFNEYGSGGEGADWIGFDENDNIYVAGSMMNEEFDMDYCLVKYDTDGNVLWNYLYPSVPGGTDFLSSATMDPEGNVYLNGYGNFIPDANIAYDFLTFKIDPDGNEIWHLAHDGDALSEDYCWAIDLDSQNNVYVAGVTINDNTFTFDATTVKYAPAPQNVGDNFSIEMQVYPNPCEGTFQLTGTNSNSIPSRVYFYDISGKLLRQEKFVGLVETYDVSDFSDGTYILMICNESEPPSSATLLLSRPD